MEIVATSDLIRPKPTYNPRIITSRFSPHREESPLSPYKQYLPTSSPHDSTSPRNGQPTPCQVTSVTFHIWENGQLMPGQVTSVTFHILENGQLTPCQVTSVTYFTSPRNRQLTPCQVTSVTFHILENGQLTPGQVTSVAFHISEKRAAHARPGNFCHISHL